MRSQTPALTTVRAQLMLAGERAAEAIMRQIDDAPSAVQAPLTAELVVRGSTGITAAPTAR